MLEIRDDENAVFGYLPSDVQTWLPCEVTKVYAHECDVDDRSSDQRYEVEFAYRDRLHWRKLPASLLRMRSDDEKVSGEEHLPVAAVKTLQMSNTDRGKTVV